MDFSFDLGNIHPHPPCNFAFHLPPSSFSASLCGRVSPRTTIAFSEYTSNRTPAPPCKPTHISSHTLEGKGGGVHLVLAAGMCERQTGMTGKAQWTLDRRSRLPRHSQKEHLKTQQQQVRRQRLQLHGQSVRCLEPSNFLLLLRPWRLCSGPMKTRLLRRKIIPPLTPLECRAASSCRE